jgi:hypothetical protein
LVSTKTEGLKWQIQLSHRVIDDVNLGKVMNLRSVKGKVPKGLKFAGNPRVVYKFGRTIGSRVLNYNNVLKNTGKLSNQDILDMGCNCEGSEFKHPQFGHIMTGNLGLIKDEGLRSICAKGTKFREVPYSDVAKIRGQIRADVGNISKKWATKNKVSNSSLKKWREEMFRVFSDGLGHYSKVGNYKRPVLSNRRSKCKLERLRGEFVITVVDKAAGNFAFTCRKFYFLKLAEELELNNEVLDNETYAYTGESEQEICDRICVDLAKFWITPNEKDKKLEILYQTPKFNKNPPKMRYIAGNVGTVLSGLDQRVAKILKMCKSHFKNLCKKNREFLGVR